MLMAICVECFTTGVGILSTTELTTDQNLLDDIPAATLALVDDPQGFLADVFGLNFQIDFQDLSGHFEFDVSFAGEGSLTIPLLPPITPLGVDVCEKSLC